MKESLDRDCAFSRNKPEKCKSTDEVERAIDLEEHQVSLSPETLPDGKPILMSSQ